MKAVNILFPNQLFLKSPLLDNDYPIYLVEEYLFFSQYAFHKQKIAFHRASMLYYNDFLENKNKEVVYIDATDDNSDIRKLIATLIKQGTTEIHIIEPVDNWLEKHIHSALNDCELVSYNNPLFINTKSDLKHFFKPEKKSFSQTTFYKQQRKKRNILIDDDDNPEGGKWTYDTENRKKYPKDKTPPNIHYPESSSYWEKAVMYTQTHFKKNPGNISKQRLYPITHEESLNWLQQFLEYRFYDFGIYEDAIVKAEIFLNHSVLTPMLNVGLISPHTIIDKTLQFSQEENIPINSTEGFIRQIIGWREFMRGMYELKGSFARTKNFWSFKRRIPKSFYEGSTGIEPVDDTIKKILKTGYCHHIERLMILGNFMLLCEFHPDAVYQWFMELFIDAYDWVMVPNVYSMSQFADGGTFATKPYLSSSNYIKKMSNYSGGSKWETIWDGLFWRFVHEHQKVFESNPRTSMMYHNLKRLSDDKKEAHFKAANDFLDSL
ncbi:cryptochrome/photolyase family protein [Hanstruepera ponticola]|uniref:cryptochrome/photolyase family protein n=1 Tax=Hanstruepera ponticola TaxID=2042995 RepID=UPI000CF03A82|nr:cryptochrome/photolyase family protein [Hanstruepera ponticola]